MRTIRLFVLKARIPGPGDLGSPNIPILNVITSKYGSVSKYCDDVSKYLNNENSPFLVYSLLMLRKGSTLSILHSHGRLFASSFWFASLYFLALWGLGALQLLSLLVWERHMFSISRQATS